MNKPNKDKFLKLCELIYSRLSFLDGNHSVYVSDKNDDGAYFTLFVMDDTALERYLMYQDPNPPAAIEDVKRLISLMHRAQEYLNKESHELDKS